MVFRFVAGGCFPLRGGGDFELCDAICDAGLRCSIQAISSAGMPQYIACAHFHPQILSTSPSTHRFFRPAEATRSHLMRSSYPESSRFGSSLAEGASGHTFPRSGCGRSLAQGASVCVADVHADGGVFWTDSGPTPAAAAVTRSPSCLVPDVSPPTLVTTPNDVNVYSF